MSSLDPNCEQDAGQGPAAAAVYDSWLLSPWQFSQPHARRNGSRGSSRRRAVGSRKTQHRLPTAPHCVGRAGYPEGARPIQSAPAGQAVDSVLSNGSFGPAAPETLATRLASHWAVAVEQLHQGEEEACNGVLSDRPLTTSGQIGSDSLPGRDSEGALEVQEPLPEAPLQAAVVSSCVEQATAALETGARSSVGPSSPETVQSSSRTATSREQQPSSTPNSMQETREMHLAGHRDERSESAAKDCWLLEAWCGRCELRSVESSEVWKPSKETFNTAIQSAHSISHMQEALDHSDFQTRRGVERDGADEHADVHGRAMALLDAMQVPSFQEPSRFRAEAHGLFPHLSVEQFEKLELQVYSQKVKAPMLKQFVAKEKDRKESQGQHREALEFETLREAAKKPAERRIKEETALLHRFLQKTDFFMHIPSEILERIIPYVTFVHMDEHEKLWSRGTAVKHLQVILRGEIQLEERKGGTDGLSRRRQVWNILGKGKVLGATETFEDSRAVYSAVPEPVNISTAFSRSGVDLLSLALADVLPILLRDAHEVKRRALKELFPLTKDKTDRELQAASRVDRAGKRLRIEDLFQVRGIARSTVLFDHGEMLSPGAAMLSMIVFGDVELSDRGRVVSTLTEGALVGKEALQRRPYANRAVVSSDTACLLQILVADYLLQFQSNARADKRQQQQGSAETGQQAKSSPSMRLLESAEEAGGNTTEQESSRQQPAGDQPLLVTRGKPRRHQHVRQLAEVLKRPTKAKQDAMSLLESEWRLLRPKKIPQRIEPGSRPGVRQAAVAEAQPALENDGPVKLPVHTPVVDEEDTATDPATVLAATAASAQWPPQSVLQGVPTAVPLSSGGDALGPVLATVSTNALELRTRQEHPDQTQSTAAARKVTTPRLQFGGPNGNISLRNAEVAVPGAVELDHNQSTQPVIPPFSLATSRRTAVHAQGVSARRRRTLTDAEGIPRRGSVSPR
mmetsp:Transcript_1061/g.2404  ORF Transcript_1061/g.2404 Transcript_1061/m.2404 type:complete len:970 (-) Transcript_1061:48-2957(-)